jgi:SPP1 family predicted phage head-tail adaptor
MRAGTMSTRVEVQERTLAINSYGERTESEWTTIGRRWVWIRPLKTEELFASSQTRAYATHEIRMRYWDRITHQHRLKDGSVYYNISEVLNMNNRDNELKLLCRVERD